MLLPHTYITLVFFGEAVYNLVKTAKQHHPGSLATQDIVWSYHAPKQSGQGAIRVKLYSKSATWTRQVPAGGDEPDVLIGLNAGLMAYPVEWSEPILASTM